MDRRVLRGRHVGSRDCPAARARRTPSVSAGLTAPRAPVASRPQKSKRSAPSQAQGLLPRWFVDALADINNIATEQPASPRRLRGACVASHRDAGPLASGCRRHHVRSPPPQSRGGRCRQGMARAVARRRMATCAGRALKRAARFGNRFPTHPRNREARVAQGAGLRRRARDQQPFGQHLGPGANAVDRRDRSRAPAAIGSHQHAGVPRARDDRRHDVVCQAPAIAIRPARDLVRIGANRGRRDRRQGGRPKRGTDLPAALGARSWQRSIRRKSTRRSPPCASTRSRRWSPVAAFSLRSGMQVQAIAVQISVADTGPGIATEVRQHLFDPFYSGREAGRGLGFGLSKCWRIVRLHGGQVDVSCPDSGGAVFTITLPATAKS